MWKIIKQIIDRARIIQEIETEFQLLLDNAGLKKDFYRIQKKAKKLAKTTRYGYLWWLEELMWKKIKRL